MQTIFDPQIPEWGNLLRLKIGVSRCEFIALGSKTRGSETSQYPKEKKPNGISGVVASEMEKA